MATTILQAGPDTPIATPDDVAQVAADLRYRIAEAGYATTGAKLPEGVTITIDGEPCTNPLIWYEGYQLWTIDETYTTWGRDGVLQETPSSEFLVQYYLNGEPIDTPPNLLVPRALADRTVNLITATNEASIDIALPEAVTVDGVRYCRDFLLDVDNSANASDLALEFTGLGVDYAFVPLEDDSMSEMMTIGGGERVRLYFTETPYTETGSLPVINVARVTLGDFVTSTTTQGGNS